MLKELGCDTVIDYKSTDYIQEAEKYDVIFDCAAYKSVSQNKNALEKDGTYLLAGGSVWNMFSLVFTQGIRNMFDSKQCSIVSQDSLSKEKRRELLEETLEFVEHKGVKAYVQKVVGLDQVGEAIGMLYDREVVGKVVVKVFEEE